jgi:tetratricopeptide (TPR) repeat protein
MVAYHWRSALELAGASGEDTAPLVERTRLSLLEAGDRAFGLNAFGPAVAYYEDALALWGDDATGRAELLFRKAHALHVMGGDGQESALEEARDALLEVGDDETAGQAEAFLSRAEWYRGHGEEAERHIERAQELVADAGPTVAKARVLCLLARLRMLSGEQESAIRTSTEALSLAETLDLDELRIHALTTLGSAKTWLDRSGEADLQRALKLATAVNSPLAGTVLNNLAVFAAQTGQLDRADELVTETLELAQQFGDRENVRFSIANLLFHAERLGRWDEVLANADLFITECEVSPHNMETSAREIRGRIRFARGDTDGAFEDWERALGLAREMKSPDRIIPALLAFVRPLLMLGRVDEARRFAVAGTEAARANPALASILSIIAGQAWRLGTTSDVIDVLLLAPDGPWKDAGLAEARGVPAEAAELYERMDAPALVADVRFDAAEALFEEGRTAEGVVELEKALTFYRSVGATFFLERGQALLAEAKSA